MRHKAHSIIWESPTLKSEVWKLLKQEYEISMKHFPAIQDYHWIKNVQDEDFLRTLHFQQTSQQQALEPTYEDNLLEFIRYSKNVGQHVRDMVCMPK